MAERKTEKKQIARSSILAVFLQFRGPVGEFNQEENFLTAPILILDSELKKDLGDDWDALALYPIATMVEKFDLFSEKLDLSGRLQVYTALFGIGYQLGDLNTVTKVKNKVLLHMDKVGLINKKILSDPDKVAQFNKTVEGIVEAGARIKLRNRDIKDVF